MSENEPLSSHPTPPSPWCNFLQRRPSPRRSSASEAKIFFSLLLWSRGRGPEGMDPRHCWRCLCSLYHSVYHNAHQPLAKKISRKTSSSRSSRASMDEFVSLISARVIPSLALHLPRPSSSQVSATLWFLHGCLTPQTVRLLTYIPSISPLPLPSPSSRSHQAAQGRPDDAGASAGGRRLRRLFSPPPPSLLPRRRPLSPAGWPQPVIAQASTLLVSTILLLVFPPPDPRPPPREGVHRPVAGTIGSQERKLLLLTPNIAVSIRASVAVARTHSPSSRI